MSGSLRAEYQRHFNYWQVNRRVRFARWLLQAFVGKQIAWRTRNHATYRCACEWCQVVRFLHWPKTLSAEDNGLAGGEGTKP